MGTWLERLASGTRGRLLALLQRSKQSVNELAAAVGISDNAVRTHLGALQRDGLVEEAGVPEARVEAEAAALRSLGGDVEVKRTDSGWELRGHGCPLSGVVVNHPELCVLAQALVEEITGVRVTEACQREGRPRCSFHVPRTPSKARPVRAGKT